MARVMFTRRYSFRAVHNLRAGVHRERTHGHQYFVEITSTQSPQLWQERLHQQVIEKLHGQDLSNLVEAATGEVLVEWIQARCQEDPVLGGHIVGVALQETAKNRFVSSATVKELL